MDKITKSDLVHSRSKIVFYYNFSFEKDHSQDVTNIHNVNNNYKLNVKFGSDSIKSHSTLNYIKNLEKPNPFHRSDLSVAVTLDALLIHRYRFSISRCFLAKRS